MLLSTSCEVDMLDTSFCVRTDENKVNMKNKDQIFFAWNKKLVNKNFIV